MKVSPVDLNLLAVLDAIGQTASVSEAARRIGISKTAMSHALARLRAQLADPVLVRAGQGWQLSERALALRERVQQVAAAAGELLAPEVAFDPARSTREFRVHATDHLLALLGARLGQAMARAAPHCALRFLPIQSDDSGSLRGGKVDLALGVFPELSADFRTQALFGERFACVVRQGHPLISGRLSLERFLELKHVSISPRGRAGSAIDDLLQRQGKSRRITRFVPYFVVALELVAQTDCVLTVSERLALLHAERLKLQVLAPPLPLPGYTISQVWHPRVDADPGHRWFRRLMAATAKELRGQDRPRRPRNP